MNTGKHASDFGTLAIEDGILMLPPNTKLVEMMAFYAPFQKINADGEPIAIDAATAGRYEQYSSEGTVSDNACTFGVWKVDCSRIRIAASTGIGNEFIRLTAAGFIPTGSKEPLTAADPILLATDSKLNAYVYGSWYDKDVVFQVETKAAAAADFKLVFQKTLTAAEFTDGKSYAFNAIGANDANTYMGSAAVFDNLYSNEAQAALAKDKWFLMDASVSDYAMIYYALVSVESGEPNRRISIEMPNCVTSVGTSAFRGCAALTSVSLPFATSVGIDAFFGCTSLTSVTLTKATSVGDAAFTGCTSLTSVTLTKATAVGANAFNGCASLTSVTLPLATTVGANAFSDCASLTSVSLPAATAVGEYAFIGCASLTSVSLPAATTVGTCAFDGCTVLTALTFNTPITSWGVGMLDGTIAKKTTLTLAPAQMEMEAVLMEAKGVVFVPTAKKFFDGTDKTEFGGETYKAIIAAPVR